MFINPLTSPKLINTLLSVYSSKGREWANAGNLFVWSQDSSAVKFAHAVLLTGFFTTGKWLMKTIKGNMEGKVMAENNNTRKHRAEFSGWCWSQQCPPWRWWTARDTRQLAVLRIHPIFIIIRHPRATAVAILCRPHWEKTWLYYRSVEVWALHGTEWASKILENHGNWIKFRKMDPILFPTIVPTIPCLSFTGNKKGKDTHDLQQYSTLKTACKQN